jgi:hypothetical protein
MVDVTSVYPVTLNLLSHAYYIRNLNSNSEEEGTHSRTYTKAKWGGGRIWKLDSNSKCLSDFKGGKKSCGVDKAGSEEVQWHIFVTAKLHPLWYWKKSG